MMTNQHERIIDGADDRSRKHDGRLPSHAAGRVIDILAHVVADFPLERLETFVALGRDLGPMHEIEPEHPERQALAEVTEHPLCCAINCIWINALSQRRGL